tara:strand:- start:35 stop:814 length:780 start_codon:yes stop_codon:yes gene_type:complete
MKKKEDRDRDHSNSLLLTGRATEIRTSTRKWRIAERVRHLANHTGLDEKIDSSKKTETTSKPTTPDQRRLSTLLERHVRRTTDGAIDNDRLRTTLEWYNDFRAETGADAFAYPCTKEKEMANQESLELFAAYIHHRGSRQRRQQGKHVSAKTISAYVSTLRIAASRACGHPIIDETLNIRLPILLRQYRKEQPPGGGHGGECRLSRGIRARHLQKSGNQRFQSTHATGCHAVGSGRSSAQSAPTRRRTRADQQRTMGPN